MPTIKPISALRNYTTVVNEVSYGSRVYLSGNDHKNIALIDTKELNELEENMQESPLYLRFDQN